MKPFHPFPARMAPEIALKGLAEFRKGATVLDPMCGSGTVLRQAAYNGIDAIGFDMDPLAVLMSKVATSRLKTSLLLEAADHIKKQIDGVDGRRIRLPWIDDDTETTNFIDYWFAPNQKRALRKIAYLFQNDHKLNKNTKLKDALLIALSRQIVTKEQKISLARDTSHSRPHRVSDHNDYDVLIGFSQSIRQIARLIESHCVKSNVRVRRGDARKLTYIGDDSIDGVITSPPYLNAIDYLRGHKMSLVWFGYSVSEIRKIRSNSIGVEKGPENTASCEVDSISRATGNFEQHDHRTKSMIQRFADDLINQTSECARVLKVNGKAIYVVGDSCLRGNYVKNSKATIAAAQLHGLELINSSTRSIPNNNRYLPTPKNNENSLAKRMRKESVLTFKKVA